MRGSSEDGGCRSGVDGIDDVVEMPVFVRRAVIGVGDTDVLLVASWISHDR